jgi:hypothetical protein
MNPLKYGTLTKCSLTVISLSWVSRHCSDPTKPEVLEDFQSFLWQSRDRTPRKLLKSYELLIYEYIRNY